MPVTRADIERSLAGSPLPAGSYRPAAGAAPTHDVDVTLRTPAAPPAATTPPARGITIEDVRASLARDEPQETPPGGWRAAMRLPVLAAQEATLGTITDTLGLPADLVNLGLQGLEATLQATGIRQGPLARVPGGSEQLRQLATETVPDVLGLPRPLSPATPTERIVSRGARLAGNVLGQSATLGALRGVPAVASRLGREIGLGAAAGTAGGAVTEVTGSPTAGAVTEVLTGLAPTGTALLKKGVQYTPPGKMLARTQAEERLAAQTQEVEAAIEQSRATMQAELDTLEDLREQALATARVQSGAAKRQARERLAVLDAEIAQAKEASQRHLEALQPRAQQEVSQARQQALATRGQEATAARQFMRSRQVPTEQEIADLFGAVRQHKFLLPTDLLEGVQQHIGGTMRTVRRFFPRAGTSEAERLGTAPVQRLEFGDAPEVPNVLGFVRQNKGIRLTGEELSGELRPLVAPLETGTTGLLNDSSGISLQNMAERAAEAGIIARPEKTALLEAMDQALRNPSQADLVDQLGDFFDRAAGQAPALPTEMTFQEAKTLLTWLGQRIGSLRKATTPDAGEQLGAVKQLYSAVQQTLDRAITRGDLPADARRDLQAANSAYKTRATMEALADEIEDAISIRPGEFAVQFNPGKVLDALRKGPEGKFLRQRLDEIGAFSSTMDFLTASGARIRQAAQRVPATRQAMQAEIRAARRAAREHASGLAQRRGALVEGAEQTQAQIQAEGEIMARQAQAARQPIQARQAAEEAALRAPLAAAEAALPPQARQPSLPFWMGGLALSSWYKSPEGVLLTLPIVIARAMMTKPGQRMLAAMLRENNGVLDATHIRALAAIVLRSSELSGHEPEGTDSP